MVSSENRPRTSTHIFRSTPPELLHQLKDSGASLIFVQPRLLHVLQAALELGAPNYTLSSDRIILLCPPAEKPSDMPYRCLEELWSKAGMPKRLTAEREKETAYLCYSPGTAGKARGVMTSHHNVTSQVQAYDRVYGPLRHGDGILGTIPLSDMYGLTLLLHHPLTLGVPVIILPKFEPNRAIKAIRRVSFAKLAHLRLFQ